MRWSCLAQRATLPAARYFPRCMTCCGMAARGPPLLLSLACPPAMFPVVVRGLAAAGCTEGARVVVEKPFGRDLESAQSLNATLYEALHESGILRIDHYLGKEAVQNILYFRFANSFLEPIWNRNHIRQIQITMSENFVVAGRGRFYDSVGAIRDVLQNHLLQILALLAMGPPAGTRAGAGPHGQ